MWSLALARIALGSEPSWVDTTLDAWSALPPEQRIEALRGMVTGEADEHRKSALIALGRLAQSLPSDASAETHAIYARELLAASDAGRRSYVIAAAGFGAAVDGDGLPTMTVEQARTLYAERRYALGVVAWRACIARRDLDTFWQVEDLEGYRDDRKARTGIAPVKWGTCGGDDASLGTGLGWTLFEGAHAIVTPSEQAGCEPVELRFLGAPKVAPDGLTWSAPSAITMTPRVQDCGTIQDLDALAGERNTQLRADLGLDVADVEDLHTSPSTLDGFRVCASKRMSEAMTELCAIR